MSEVLLSSSLHVRAGGRYLVSRIRIFDMLRPIDLTVLAFLRSEYSDSSWTQMDVAVGLGIAQSSVHRALRQLEHSALLQDVRPFRELLVHAVRHVYPPELGAPARGVLTAHAHPSIAAEIQAGSALVWPLDAGEDFGPSIEPLHACVPGAALRHPRFYELMAIVDVLRVGRVRERQVATRRLDELLELG